MESFILIVFVVGLLVLVPIYQQPLIRVLLRRPIRRLGLTLKDANVELHRCELADKPDRRPEWESILGPDGELSEAERAEAEKERDQQIESDQLLEWYQLEVTVGPNSPPDIAFDEWLPCEIALIPSDSDYAEGDPLDDACDVAKLEILQDDEWKIDNFSEHRGAQRIKLLIGTKPEHRRLTFQYFYERFGLIDLSG